MIKFTTASSISSPRMVDAMAEILANQLLIKSLLIKMKKMASILDKAKMREKRRFVKLLLTPMQGDKPAQKKSKKKSPAAKA
jgi:hypothetical protein